MSFGDDTDKYIYNEVENCTSINKGNFNDSKYNNTKNLYFLQKKTKSKDLTLEETIKMMSIKKNDDESSNSSLNNDIIYTILNKNENKTFEIAKQIEHHIDSINKNKDKKDILYENKFIQTDECNCDCDSEE